MNANRIRWGVRAALTLGVAASITGNVLHANNNLIAQIIAAWSPLALLITVELIAWVPVHRLSLAVARLATTALIAGIAAWVSYWHMVAVASRYGETDASPYLIPLSVDGLVVVASICLVELSGRIRAAGNTTEGDSRGATREKRQELLPGTGGDAAGLGEAVEGRGGTPAAGATGEGVREVGAPAEGAGEPVAEPTKLSPPPVRVRKPHTTNPERVARAWQKTPDASPADIAKRLKLSRATVNRHRPVAEKINGHVPELQEVK